MSRVFGLTGGIACGKSSVSRIFAEAGVPVVDADLVAREVVAPGSKGLSQITAAFGDVLLPDGTLDRAKLGSLVFIDPKQRDVLNGIMFPLISERSGSMMRECISVGAELVCYDAPTLIEVGMHERFRPLVVVVVPAEVQLKRLIERDGFTRGEALARISSQLPMDQKAELADFVIENTGTLDDLRVRALEVLEEVREICR